MSYQPLAVVSDGRYDAQPVSVRRLLHFDDIGAERRELAAGEGSRDEDAEVKDLDAGKRLVAHGSLNPSGTVKGKAKRRSGLRWVIFSTSSAGTPSNNPLRAFCVLGNVVSEWG